jgi:hypothetical protein
MGINSAPRRLSIRRGNNVAALTFPGRDMKGSERFVIDIVAAWFSGSPRSGEDPPDAYLTIGDREIAVEISTLTQYVTDKRGRRPRFSDEKFAQDFIRELKLALNELVPEGQRIGLSLSLPILEPQKAKAALTNFLRQNLVKQSLTTDTDVQFFGNSFAIRIHYGGGERIFAFIAHRSSNPDVPLNAKAKQVIEECVTKKARKCVGLVGKSKLWLALLNDYPLADANEYKIALAHSAVEHPFEKIVLVSRDGTVDLISGTG